MGSCGIHRFLIPGFLALLLANVVQPTIPISAYLANELPLRSDPARLTGRIVNGTEATVNQFPHAVSLRYTASGNHFCGGSIIHARWILTAAHCMFTSTGAALQLWQLTIVAGDLWLNETSTTSQTSPATQIIVHDDYDNKAYHNDIALVKLTRAFTFEDPAVQYQIIRSNKVSVGKNCQVAGWGYPDYHAPAVTNELMYVDVPIMDQSLCARLYTDYSDIPDGMICAGYVEGMKDSCSGDSGSGLICDDILTGIVSWGQKCALPNYPGVYTDVWYYKNWIAERVPNITIEDNDNGNGAGTMKFSLWMLPLSLAVVGLLTRS